MCLRSMGFWCSISSEIMSSVMLIVSDEHPSSGYVLVPQLPQGTPFVPFGNTFRVVEGRQLHLGLSWVGKADRGAFKQPQAIFRVWCFPRIDNAQIGVVK